MSNNKKIDHTNTTTEDTVNPLAHQADAPTTKALSVKLIVIIVAVLVVIATVIAVACFIFDGSRSSQKDPSSGKSGQVERTTTDRVLTAAFILVDGESLTQGVTATAIGGQTQDGSVLYDFAPYRVSGSSYSVLPETGSGNTVVVTDAAAEPSYARVVKSFQDSGLKRSSADISDAVGLKLNPHVVIAAYETYISDHTVCSLARLVAKGAQQGSQLISSGCAAVSNYEKVTKAAAPFNEAYVKAFPEASEGLVLSAPEIGNDTKKATVFQQVNGVGAVHTYTQAAGDKWVYEKAL